MERRATHRRLAAILAADVAGYSRLMGRDEEGTLAALRAHRRELVNPKIAEHNGRVVKTTGDGMLLEFASVVDAVRCAVAVQQGMRERNAQVPTDRRIAFRVGVNLGDVLIEDGDVFGDGVNMAARLEALAPPGGICISSKVHEEIQGKLAVGFEDAGEHKVKNIERPIRVWRWTPAADAAAASGELALPDKPSIAVLPFDNMSDDPEQGYFADGITEDLITDLSRIGGLFVVARNSTFAYKDQHADLRHIAGELGVRYVLEGSVRRAADRVRINAQLIDAHTGGHLWADRYDRAIEDVFAIQDELVRHIAAALCDTLHLDREPARRHRMRAYELVLKSYEVWREYTAAANDETKHILDEAINLDPGYAKAHSRLALCHWFDWHYRWVDDPANSLTRALELAERALQLDPDESSAYGVKGNVLLFQRRYTEALRSYQSAITIDPNNADVFAWMAECLNLVGRSQDAVQCVQKAMRLNPHYPDWYLWQLAFDYYALRDYEWALRTLRRMRAMGEARRILAASLAQLGRIDEARAEACAFLRDNPTFTISYWARTQPFRNPADREHFVAGYRKAGLPE